MKFHWDGYDNKTLDRSISFFQFNFRKQVLFGRVLYRVNNSFRSLTLELMISTISYITSTIKLVAITFFHLTWWCPYGKPRIYFLRWVKFSTMTGIGGLVFHRSLVSGLPDDLPSRKGGTRALFPKHRLVIEPGLWQVLITCKSTLVRNSNTMN